MRVQRDININIHTVFCLIVSGIILCSLAQGQRAGNYAFSTLTTASLLPMEDHTTTLVHGPNAHLRSSPVFPIGFEFWFMGVRYTQFSVNSNGVVRLGSEPIINTGNSYGIANNARLVPFVGTDFDMQNQTLIGSLRTSSTGRVHFRRAGNAPNRFLVIESRNMAVNYTSSTADATFQIVIYESSPGSPSGGRIEFRYGQVRSTVELSSLNIGIGGGNQPELILGVNLNPISAREGSIINNPIGVGIVGPLHSNAEGQRRQFTFDPPMPNGLLTNLTVNCQGNDAAELHWNNQATNAVGTVIYRSEDGNQYEFLAQVNRGNTYVDGTIQRGKTYYYRAYAVTEGKLSPLDPTGQAVFSPQVPPPLRLPSQITVCEGESITLDAGPGYALYQWSDGYIGQQRVLRPTSSTVLTLTAKGCSERQAQVKIHLAPLPIFQIKGDSTICPGESFALLEAPHGRGSYQWQNARGQIIGSSPTLMATQVGKYFLTITSPAGCSFRDSIQVTDCCPPLIELPTAFTPHSTPANNLFRIYHQNLQSVDIQIYNRWGNLVYRSHNPDQGWDGTFEGKPAQAGVYQVIVWYTACRNGVTFSGKVAGVLHLLE
ncbi:MAG: gliding motility-associated C-terminal domain-containing protein [Cytophagales bacterium]|nr:gliding motility-associated C-terminal domain-containing protein [Bernardetiaceae bacterium]MDW8209761.1 gliding motility-associated C-terminal domain-containing protein [Cytophagales bacterium]